MSTILEIKELCGGYEKSDEVLQGINLNVAQGESVGIIGLNGSGKSTFGKAVMNMLPYRKGSIVFNQQHVEKKSTYELTQLGIAIMHQGGVVFPNLSVWQNLQLAFGNKQHTTHNAQLQEIIPLLHQPKKELMRIMADKLSGGQRHELALAMTMARSPKLVILDEPSAGLSPKDAENTYAMLRQLREEFDITILVIEQNISRAKEFCSRCLLFGQGKIQCEYSGDSLKVENIESLLFN